MNYVEFGNTKEKVSEMCLGTMMFGTKCDYAESDRIINAALDQDVNFIDTAAMYGNGRTEEFLGRIIKGRRNKLFIGTKVHKGVDAQSILTSIDESLARMQLDYVDLYMIHWAVDGMNPEEIMEALNNVVLQGKARFVGCSNYPAWLFAYSNAIASHHGWAKLVCNQVAYNLIERGVEVEILPQAVAENIAITVYRPCAEGLLTGKYRHGHPLPENSRGQLSAQIITWTSQHGYSIEQYLHFAEELGVHPVQLAIAWLRYSIGVTSPIVGVSKLSQLQSSIDAFNFNLTPTQYERLTFMFNTEVKEEGFQKFPGLNDNFPHLRRNLDLLNRYPSNK